MGVKGLQTYIENFCPEACYQVSIRDLIITYRRETGREAVIVVDGSSCLRFLYQGASDWVLGGQLKEYTEMLKKFVNAFQSAGAKLVIFFDGATIERKRPVWIQRRLRNLQDVYKIFDCLNTWKRVSYIDQSLFQLPAGLGGITRFLFKELSGCEVRTSIRECDEEIAEYARNKQCFAILGQDTDYIIYEGGQYYLSIKDLNLEKMTTLNYNRWALARHLHINPVQLPVLATLVGNDVVSPDDLKEFHIDICHRPGMKRYNHNSRIRFDILISNVAGFIRTLPCGEDVFRVLPAVAHRVFHDERKANILDSSIRSYSTDPSREYAMVSPSDNWNVLMSMAKKKLIHCEFPPHIWSVMSCQLYESSTALEDFREDDLPPAALALRLLRKRIYGLLLREKPSSPGEAIVVTEWCMHGEESLNNPALVRPAIVQGEAHPGLLKLWEDGGSEELRWRVFSAAVSSRLDHRHMRSLPPHLVIPTAVLTYLTWELVETPLVSWEVDALLALAVIMEEYTADDLARMAVPNVHVRGVRIATLYLRGCTNMQLLLATCGYPISIQESMPSHFFDGKLFSSLYHKAKHGAKYEDLCLQKANLIELFLKIQQMVFRH